jgi:hypothetical protein
MLAASWDIDLIRLEMQDSLRDICMIYDSYKEHSFTVFNNLPEYLGYCKSCQSPREYGAFNRSMMVYKLPLQQVVGYNSTEVMKVSPDRSIDVGPYYDRGKWSA